MQNIFLLYNFLWKHISYILTYMVRIYLLMWVLPDLSLKYMDLFLKTVESLKIKVNKTPWQVL